MKRATLILTIFLVSLSCIAQENSTIPVDQATLDSLKLCSPFRSFAEAENALRNAQIIDSKELGTGVTNPIKLYLKTDTTEFKAVFKSINDKRFGITNMQKGAEVDFKDSWMYEIVAYELDKLLGLNMVPPTVERMFKNKKGSVQLWVENALTERERKSKHMEDKVIEPEASTAKQLQECLDLNKWLSIHPDGPLWFRGYATWNDTEGSQNVNVLLQKYKATRFVTAHSVQAEGEIKARFDTKIILIDTGMLSAPFFPGGRASALEINNGKITAIYSGERKPL